MDGYVARPPISIQQLDKTGDQERFIVRVQSSSGGNGLPYDEFILSISDTCLATWEHANGIKPKQIAEQLATMIVELHGNAAKFKDNYFFATHNTNSVGTVEDVVDQMQTNRNLDEFIDTRDT
jgi:hypothetical protein